AEMRADRRDAVGAGDIDLDEMAAIGMRRFDLDGLARQRIGHIERACRRIGDAVAAPAESGDYEAFDHGRNVSLLNRRTSSAAKVVTASEKPIQMPTAPRPNANASA